MLGLPEAPRGMRHAPGRSPIGREPLPTGRKCAAMDRGRERTVPSVGVADTVSAWVGVASEGLASEVAASEVAAEVAGGAGDDRCPWASPGLLADFRVDFFSRFQQFFVIMVAHAYSPLAPNPFV